MDHFGLILEPPRIGGRAEPILEDLVQEAYTDPPRDLKKRRFSFVSVIFSRPRSASAGERDLEAVNSVMDTNSVVFGMISMVLWWSMLFLFSRPRAASAGERALEAVSSIMDANSMHFGMVLGVCWWSMLFLFSRPRSASAGERALDALSSVMET